MWVFVVTDAMSFGALGCVFAGLRARAASWPHAPLDLRLGAAATLALLASSLTLARGRVGATLALGLAFVGAQGFEYLTLARHGVELGGDEAIFFLTTGWHGLHVVAGLIALLCVRRGTRAAASAALFWQFVDAVWIVLFTAFYLAPAVSTAAAAALGVAAAAAFAALVFFAMSLRREPRAVKVVFVLPLALPISFVVSVVADAVDRGLRP